MKRLKLALVILLFAGLMIGCVLGSVRFPTPSEGYQPKVKYKISYDKMWNIIDDVLESNRINIASQDKQKGITVTEYIQGQTETMGPLGTIQTRYKYNIKLKKDENATTKLAIICNFESSGNKMHAWREISADNKERVEKLEKWLYEQIEKKLNGNNK